MNPGKETIAAVVVTFNRLKLLKRTINALRNQTWPIAEIVVVNNGCTDGTGEWLEAQKDLTVITQDNVGGSGGFHTGIGHAATLHTDFIWCMDDDVFPTPTCLERLLEAARTHNDAAILAPRRWQEGRIVCHDFTDYNLTPLGNLYGAAWLHRLRGGQPWFAISRLRI